ncbi:MAG TPA: flagellar export protein FliJ [Burkholderiaceae bacterium]|nr:flagellar export protein FliJ [Burkholderiaceae bacterium]
MNDTLNLLLQHAEAERDEALALLQQINSRAEAARAQHDQLMSYRDDYRQRWSGRFSQGGAIEIVQCYHSFSERLEQAICQQSQMVSQLVAQAERLREQLKERELRAASVGKLIERRRQELDRSNQRREQKTADEAAQRAAWNGRLLSRAADPFS